MFSSATITSVSLTLSALLLSATANPLQARDGAFSVSCDPAGIPEDVQAQIPHGDLESWCTSQAVSLVCSPQGNLIADPNVPGALPFPTCNEHCKCVPAGPPAPPIEAPQGIPTPVTAPAPPAVLTCSGNLDWNADLHPAVPTKNQDYCTGELVTTVCEDGRPKVYGIDNYDVCLKVCTC